MEDDGARVELERRVRVNLGSIPTGGAVPRNGQHVIGKVGAKDERLGRWWYTRSVRFGDNDSGRVEVLETCCLPRHGIVGDGGGLESERRGSGMAAKQRACWGGCCACAKSCSRQIQHCNEQ